MGFGLNLEYLGEMGRGVLLPTGIRRDAIGKISDFELDAKWRWNEEEKCSHAWSGLILVVCLIAASLREECLLLRCPPLLLTSPTNSQSGLILEILSFLTLELDICTRYQIEYMI